MELEKTKGDEPELEKDAEKDDLWQEKEKYRKSIVWRRGATNKLSHFLGFILEKR